MDSSTSDEFGTNAETTPGFVSGSTGFGTESTGFESESTGFGSGSEFGFESNAEPDMVEVEKSLQRLNAILRKIASCNYTFIIANGFVN